MKNDPVEKALLSLDGADPATEAGRERLTAGVHSKYNFVTAKAAQMVGRHGAVPLAPELEKALAVRLDRSAVAEKDDKGCAAKLALARAMVELEYDAPQLFARGIQYVQMEATWGQRIDVAAEFRSVCAMGLVNGAYPDKLRALLPLLMDKEWQARAGAVRAIGVEGSEAAILLLRFKAMTGDENPEVIQECFSALLSAERAQAIAFIDSFCDSTQDEIAEAAMLALGGSRRTDALAVLQNRFEQRRNPRLLKTLLLAVASSRSEDARRWLRTVAEGDGPEAAAAQNAIESCWPDEPRLRGDAAEGVGNRA
jgi:hypothetical protein